MAVAVEPGDPVGEQLVGHAHQGQRQDRDEGIGELAAGEFGRLVHKFGRVAVAFAGLERDAPAPVEVEHAHDQDEHRSEEHTSELQSLMRISYAVFCLNKKKTTTY